MKVTTMILTLALNSACGLASFSSDADEATMASEAEAIEPEISVTAKALEIPQGEESRVTLKGTIDGEAIDLIWDFQVPSPARVCNGVDTSLTNGSVWTAPSGSGETMTMILESDFGTSDCALSDNDWLIRLTIGLVNKDTTYANVKKEFALPDTPYTMVTLYQGGEQKHLHRHLEKDPTNLGLTALVTEMTYDESTPTLRVKGAAKGEWEGGDELEVQFNVLINGEDDRQLNKSTIELLKEAGGL